MVLIQITFHKLQSHLACWHTKMYTLLYKEVAKIVEIQTVQNDLLCKNKTGVNRHMCIYVYWLVTQSVKVWWFFSKIHASLKNKLIQVLKIENPDLLWLSLLKNPNSNIGLLIKYKG